MFLDGCAGIWIRGAYFKGPEATWLKDVKIVQGALNKGSETGEVHTLVNGAVVNSSSSAPAPASSDCCSSRTCVTNDKYEILFDRPGCMQSPDAYSCMGSPTSSDSCTRFSKGYDQSKAAEVIQGTDWNEGRDFTLPGRVDRCYGAGTGVGGAAYSECWDGSMTNVLANDATPLGSNQRASWPSATKNQNMGVKAIPITKPFIKDYYFNAVPRICSAATLTVEAQGDLAHSKDSIYVYGEDDAFLGILFAGNLTYLQEGQRPYDPKGAITQCDSKYDPTVVGGDAYARLADPNRPDGNLPRNQGYRGGRNDVVSPGVLGQEDTRCTPWSKTLSGDQVCSTHLPGGSRLTPSVSRPMALARMPLPRST